MWNQLLTETAHEASVITNKEFAIFHNAGRFANTRKKAFNRLKRSNLLD